MAIIEDKNHPVLRTIAAEVPVEDIHTAKIQDLLESMSKDLAQREEGVALAAPQVGESLRIFIVAGKIFDSSESTKPTKDLVFINPELISCSKNAELSDEGCLSIPGTYGKVKRYLEATIRAHDENGDERDMRAQGLLAQIFQHEIDHLNGTLYIDKAHELRNEP